MNKRILVIEDDESIREMLTFTLEIEGFKVTSVECGKDGYKKENKYLLNIINITQNLHPDFKNKAFEPFLRGNNSKGTKGNGLGLYICKYIIEDIGGRIDFGIIDNKVTLILELTLL